MPLAIVVLTQSAAEAQHKQSENRERDQQCEADFEIGVPRLVPPLKCRAKLANRRRTDNLPPENLTVAARNPVSSAITQPAARIVYDEAIGTISRCLGHRYSF